MKTRHLIATALMALALPAILQAIPQNIGGGGFPFNNIMEEEKWERPPNYQEWRMEGLGKDGRAPVAGDPKPDFWTNTKPIEVFGISAPAGAAKLATEGGKWVSVRVRLPGRKSDDFHLLMSNLKIETGIDFAVAGRKPSRSVTAAVNKLKMDIKELPSGELDVFLTRAPEATVSSR